MGKYDKYKKLVFPASLVKQTVTTSVLSNPGTKTVASGGNEGIDLAEWLQEKIDDGTIVITGAGGNTNLTSDQDSVSVSIFSDTGTDATIVAASTLRAGVMTASDKTNLEALITLSGVNPGQDDLGTFTGSTIPNNVNIKQAFQSLETVIENITGGTSFNPSDLLTGNNAISIANGANSVLDNDVTITFQPGNVNLASLGGKLNLAQLDNTSATFGQFIIFNGTDWAASNYTPTVGSGVANQVAYWSTPSTLTGNNKFLYDGDYLTLGTGTKAPSTIFTIKGQGTSNTTYGLIHRNSSSVDVFKVADNGATTIGSSGQVYIDPTAITITNGGQYNIDKSGGNLKLTSDTQVVVESGGTASNTPSLKIISTRSTNIGSLYTAQVEGTFNVGSGTNAYSDLYVSTIVNQTGGTNPIRSVYINPQIIAAQAGSLRGLEINVPGHMALKTNAGKVQFNLGSDATGDIFYRTATGELARLPVGTTNQILSSTGVIPQWVTPAAAVSGYTEIKEEGASFTNGATNTIINFVGSGITAADAGSSTTSVTLNTFLNTLATSGSVNLTSHVSGILPVANGGTSFGSYTTGDILYASSASALSKLAIGAGTTYLKGGTTPSWATLNVAALSDGSNVALLNGNQTFTGNNTFNNNITLNATPVNGNHLVTKDWVVSNVAGLKSGATTVATTGILTATAQTATTITLGGTSLTIDGHVMVNGETVLVKDSVTGGGGGTFNNGPYTVGGIGTSVVLTRVTWMDMAPEVKNTYVLILDGTTNGGSIYFTVSDVTTLGTDAISFTKLPTTGAITSLNTLNAAAQTMVTGTANNDFTITSIGSTHTFDLPTASTTKRGALSSADWTTFNNKQNAITWQNVTAGSSKITLGGTPAGSVFSAFSIDVNEANLNLNNIGGVLSVAKGGTAISSYTQGDILYASAAGTLTPLNKDTNSTRYLSNTGTSNNPAWAQINLANGVTGRLGFSNLIQIPTDTLLGRDNPGTGDVGTITVGGGIEFNGGGEIQTSAFTGDATKGAGSTVLTLATVNSNVGTFGNASNVGQFTVNGKGLITAASNIPISITSANISNFTEAVQDVVGNSSFLPDTDTIDWTYNDAGDTLSAAVKTQFSITSDVSGLKLVADVALPGNNKIYGTNGSGVKGWYDSPSGADGNGIYTGSGTVGAGNNVTATISTGKAMNFQLAGNTGGFNVWYNGGIGALEIDRSGSAVWLRDPTGINNILLTNSSASISGGAGTLDLGASELNINGAPFLWNDTLDLSPVDADAALEIRSISKAFFPPRMATADVTAMGTVNDGALLYDTDKDALQLRINGAWYTVGDTNNSPAITASNGLSRVGNDIRLGGTALSADTVIGNASAFKMTFNGSINGGNNYILNATNSSTSGGAFQGTAAGSGAGIQGLNTSTGAGVSGYNTAGGFGVQGQAESGGIGGWFTTEDTNTSSVLTGLSVFRNVTSGTGEVGVGVRIEMGAETLTVTNRRANSLISEWSSTADLTRTSNFRITTLNLGTEATKLELSGPGQLKLNSYGVGTFTGVAAKYLQVTSTGSIIEGPIVGAGGIYAGSGTIGAGVVSSTTIATMPSSGIFKINYSNVSPALQVTDATNIDLRSGDGTSILNVTNSSISLQKSAATFKVEGTAVTGVNVPILVDYTAAGTSNHAGIELRATNKVMIASRLSDTDVSTNITTPVNGSFLYNTTSNKFSFYQNGAWVTYTTGLGGIYSGSGTIATAAIATVASGSTFTFDYNGGNDAILIDDTNSKTNIKSKDGTALNSTSNTGILLSKSTNNTLLEVINGSVRAAYGDGGAAPQELIADSAGIRIDSTTKGFRPPRMTNAQRGSIVAPTAGSLVYDTTNNRLGVYNGTVWADYYTGLGGIYSGSGTIPAGTAATITSNDSFQFKYNGGNIALSIEDNNSTIYFKSKDGLSSSTIANSSITNLVGAIGYNISGSRHRLYNAPTYVDQQGNNTLNGSAALQVDSITGTILAPRMTTTQKNAINAGTITSGGFVYDTDLNKFSFRQNGAWFQLGDVTAGNGGIYSGSGNIPAATTAKIASASYFNFLYNNSSPAILIGDLATDGTTIQGKGSSKGIVQATDTQVLIKAGGSGQGVTVSETLTNINSDSTYIGGATYLRGIVDGAAVIANTNNYTISANATIVRIDVTGAFNITGFTGGAAGRILYLTNTSATNSATIKNNDAGSTDVNRVLCPTNTDYAFRARTTVMLWWDDMGGGNSRWRLMGGQ